MTHLVRLETLAQAPNFNERVFRLIEPYLGSRMLEIGTGIGNFTEKLLRGGRSVVSLEPEAALLRQARKKLGERPGLELHGGALGAGIPPFLKGRRFDAQVCLNVLEHINDDRAALKECLELLEPEGRLILVVPQYQWLFGSLDEEDGHYRRYSRAELKAKLLESGFEVIHEGCFNLAGIAGWLLNGRILKRRELPVSQMKLYDRLAPALFWLESLAGPPAGLSLFMVGRRPA